MSKETIKEFLGPYRFLSNFWPIEIRLADGVYWSVEHAYQASKTEDPEVRLRIRIAKSPGAAKRIGRYCNCRVDWDEVKVDIMALLLEVKFTNPTLRRMLLKTGDAELIEGNTWGDTFWGVCKGKGENRLGELLMDLREVLRQQEDTRFILAE